MRCDPLKDPYHSPCGTCVHLSHEWVMVRFHDVSRGMADAECSVLAGESLARERFDVQTESGRASPSGEPRLLHAPTM